MPYLHISDFKAGLDVRRPSVAGEAGTLIVATNGHITRGGDFERRKEFVLKQELPGGNFGLHSVGRSLVVFGSSLQSFRITSDDDFRVTSDADNRVTESDSFLTTLPGGIFFQRLQHPDTSTALTSILDAENFNGKIYAIAEFADGSIYHYYDGMRVTSWDTVTASAASLDTIAAALARKVNQHRDYSAYSFGAILRIDGPVGVDYTVATATANESEGTDDQDLVATELMVAVAATQEIAATAAITITGGSSGPANLIKRVTVAGADILGQHVRWAHSNAATAALVAEQINAYTPVTEFTAAADGASVTITAGPGLGASVNGNTVSAAVGGDVTVSADGVMDEGVDAAEGRRKSVEIEVTGAVEPEDAFTLTLDGASVFRTTTRASAMGTTAKTFDDKIYSVAGDLLRFCVIGDPTDWTTTASGAGFIDFSEKDGASETLVAVEMYQGSLAILSNNSIHIEDVDPDPTENLFIQTVSRTGTNAPKTVLAVNNFDTFYLSPTGLRSLRARETTNSPFVSDFGNAIDGLLKERLEGLRGSEAVSAMAIIDPIDGRYWLAIDDEIYVLSYFPVDKIAAWSKYELDFRVDAIAVAGDRIFVRSGDAIYLYGGEHNNIYPSSGKPCALRPPFLTADKPAHEKELTGIDAALENTWSVRVYLDPNDESVATPQMRISKTTYSVGRIPLDVRATHFSPEFVCSKAGPASISNITIHYNLAEAT